MQKINYLACTFFLAALLVAPANGQLNEAQQKTADASTSNSVDPEARLNKMLETLNHDFQLSESGAFEMIIDFEDGRSQLVYANLAVSDVDSSQVVEVWSPLYRSAAELEKEVTTNLLLANSIVVGGAFQMLREGDGYLVLFSSSVPAAGDARSLDRTILWVSSVTDEMERTMINKDEM